MGFFATNPFFLISRRFISTLEGLVNEVEFATVGWQGATLSLARAAVAAAVAAVVVVVVIVVCSDMFL